MRFFHFSEQRSKQIFLHAQLIPDLLRKILFYARFFFESSWQRPLIGQLPQLWPQEDFPFLLSRIIPLIINATKTTRAMLIKIVARCVSSHKIIVFLTYHN